MIKNENVLELAMKVVEMDIVVPGERLIVCKEQDQYVTLEGNRRLCVYKLLLNRNLIPTEYFSRFPIAHNTLLSSLNNISVDLVESRDIVQPVLAARHIQGVKQWSSISKWRVSYELYEQGKNVQEIAEHLILPPATIKNNIGNYKVLMRGINSQYLTNEERGRIDLLELKPDQLIRFFHLRITTDKLELRYNENHDLLSDILTKDALDRIIAELTKLAFIEKQLNTRSTYDDILPFISRFLPVPVQPTEKVIEPSPDNTIHEPSGVSSPPVNEQVTQCNNIGTSKLTPLEPQKIESQEPLQSQEKGSSTAPPYFFEGLRYGHLDKNDTDAQGLILICTELNIFSQKRYVEKLPLAAAYLIRSLIEHTFIYYAKKHNVQGQSKLIWTQFVDNKKDGKLSNIIDYYKSNLANFIPERKYRDFFTDLFSNYSGLVDPLNWCVHRTFEYTLPPEIILGQHRTMA